MQLHKTQHPTGPPDTSRIVINLCRVPLEEAVCSALSKGLNYAVAPGRIPAKNFLCGVEMAIGTLPDETAEEIRQETVRILKGSRQPKDNLTVAERRAFRSLKANASHTVLPADKGNAAVVMGTSDYNRKIATLLQNKAYSMFKKDPTESIELKTVLLLKKSSFPEEVCQQVRLQGSRSPRLYGLPKIHKPGVPLSPTISTIGSPTYCLAQHLARLPSGHTGHSPHHIKYSIEFVQVLSSLQVDTHYIMVSLDIVSLFTKVPIRETMDLLGSHFEEDVLGLFRHVLTTSYFTFNGQFYGQTDGVAMGSSFSPVIANFYLEEYEKAALESTPLKPRCWFRYVDDNFAFWQHGSDKLKDFLHHLNSINQSIQFTMETESEDHLSFLDLDI
jgi:hypothetical protein